jgi:hypothetical protein
MPNLEAELNEAEAKAWRSLASYKFMMFGYWAAIWVHLNRIGEFNRPNPFKPLVELASDMVKEAEQYKEAKGLLQ